MNRNLNLAWLAFALAACSTTPQGLEQASSTKSIVRTYPDNYQLVYKRILDPAKQCSEGGMAFSLSASLNVDAQLYNELGYGEISYSMINVGVRNYYWKAKVEKADTGSKITIYSGNTLNNAVWLNKVSGWADGKLGC